MSGSSIINRLLAFLVVLGGLYFALQWQMGREYDKGYKAAQDEAEKHAALLDRQYRLQEEADNKYAKEQFNEYMSLKSALEAHVMRLSVSLASMRAREADYRHQLSSPGSDPARAIAIGVAGFDNYLECRDRYVTMGREYAEVSNKYNALILQVTPQQERANKTPTDHETALSPGR